MAVDEQKLLQLIASEPQIRTVALADRLDCDMQEVEDALLPMINRGRIIAQPVLAPNNRRATGYTLSDQVRGEILRASQGVSVDKCASHIERAIDFIRMHDTVTGAQLHAHLGLDVLQTPSSVLAEAMADGRLFKDGKHWTLGAASRVPEAVSTPSDPAPVEHGSGTRVDRAVACVNRTGSASDDEMRLAMGIEKPTAPAAYLGSAIRNGKLHKSAGVWKAGPAPAGTVKEGFSFAKEKGPVAQFGPDVKPKELADLPRDLVEQLSKPVQRLAEAPVQQVAAPEAPKPSFPVASFRCGMFSDGVLELHRDGKVLAALSPDECAQVAEFLAKAA